MHVRNAMYQILIVEDENLLAMTLSYALEDAGYHVSIAADGREGIDQAMSTPPDLIITDFMMPRVNGIEMITRLRLAGIGCPVIMLTALPKDNIAATNYDLFVQKPYDEQRLLRSVASLLAASVVPSTPH